MQNISELRTSLADNYTKMKAGKMNPGLGKELSNAAGKIINSLKVELEYNQLMQIKKTIPFLESTTDATEPTNNS
ncbi:hypothetical protein [Spirosoma sp. 48-14]|uniref:hypothetical protein n=1 Tax=Spirosoma sp. 48-14 TaxID=1895854 RepID=UPI0025D90EE0|nr:hypothetical protein [Spirosoma sp. 48-14]